MNIVRYELDGHVHVGLHTDGTVTHIEGVSALAQLWQLPATELQARLCRSVPGSAVPLSRVRLLAPVDASTEVWACGVTYQESREARIEESERAADVYALVYDAQRPEVFFKSVPWRVRGPGAPIGIRADSEIDVPEPELAVVINRYGEIVGYTVCNDVSSRSIEAANPLYLPQAKTYYGSCALGPWITPAWDVGDPYALAIDLAIERDGREHWRGSTSTSLLHRRLDDLVGYIMRGDVHPDGAVLSTGTGLVPPAPFTLTDGDTVRITIDMIGTLTNPVQRGIPQAAAA
ncbi:fumarylacetoacetate hydrolase family protein [Dactylosporangium aurantiacum]|uniref:fumarylacetoacetate hydrolase family protein n=1 Tax=Dactylosporangium aurantiacum TaxID=35754 RepID=UPI000525D595|nr:fumarylacetoacetate hydrolase family protein [Dactylosporangium aurantiacum]MDG6108318.1 fumarylacetoacetate hydrolase family protein [Dactylosporangium aurantiacum]